MRNDDDDTVGIWQAKTVTFDSRQESKQPISLFELVADDLQTLNDNLLYFDETLLRHCLLHNFPCLKGNSSRAFRYKSSGFSW